MAERRMISKSIVSSDAFLSMPLEAQALYFHLNLNADDDGIVNRPVAVCREIGASLDNLNTLIDNKFILSNNEGIIIIKHWRINNYIRKDTYNPSKYEGFLSQLFLDKNNSYTFNRDDAVTSVLQPRNESVTEKLKAVDTGKDRLGKDRLIYSTKSGPNFKKFSQRDYNNEDLEKEIVENL